jgi:hypothetical protein
MPIKKISRKLSRIFVIAMSQNYKLKFMMELKMSLDIMINRNLLSDVPSAERLEQLTTVIIDGDVEHKIVDREVCILYHKSVTKYMSIIKLLENIVTSIKGAKICKNTIEMMQ